MFFQRPQNTLRKYPRLRQVPATGIRTVGLLWQDLLRKIRTADTAHVESIAVFEPGPKPEKIDEIDEIEIGGMTEEAEQEARSEEPKI
jgi:hypothetical protein